MHRRLPPRATRTLCILLGLAAPGVQAAQAPRFTPPSLAAARAAGEIRIDGHLDEPDWRQAGLIPTLVQQIPHPGEPTPYTTEVRVLVDGGNLYFGIRCLDPDPARITMHTMQRDAVDPFGDDFLDLVLDTFGDRHTGYLFEVYPTGAQADGLIAGPGNVSMDWDGVWEAKVQRGDDGWTAEIKIPARTLHFKAGVDSWGFNIGRHVARDRLWLSWCCASLDSDIIDVTRAGTLSGVGALDQGLGLSVSPYTLGRLERTQGAVDPQDVTADAGLDLTYSLTAGLPAVLTLNTDFAETEVDARQINLSRFSLFFPEKRPFFLEGSNQFAFGTGLGTDFIPFYSRRVGLATDDCTGSDESNTSSVPIDWGAKLVGHAGRVGIAALDIATGDSEFAPSTNLSAARLTYDATDHLRLGTIATHGCPDGVSRNTLGGADLVWHTSSLLGDKNMTAGGWAAGSYGDLPGGQHSGWGARVDFPNDRWNGYAGVKELGDALEPALGFLPRPGTRWYEIGQAYQPRPDRKGPFGWARQFFFETFYTQVDDLEGRTESRELFTAPLNVETASGEHFEVNWAPHYESLTDPFEVVSGLFIPPGDYSFTRYRAEAQSSRARPWRVGATVWFGDYYDGRLTQIENFVHWNVLRGHWQAKLDLQNDYGHLPEGDFVQRLWQLQNVCAVSPRLILSSLFQYDTDSRSLGMNSRLRWTFLPGNDLFVVWNRNWDHPVGDAAFALQPLGDEVTVKVRFVWKG